MADHQMFMAKLSPQVAKRMGLSKNHHARVWCGCMTDSKYAPGYFSTRTPEQVLADPRRLGSWDALGVVDLRIPGSALALYREHLANEGVA
jgi:hypothetical protein